SVPCADLRCDDVREDRRQSSDRPEEHRNDRGSRSLLCKRRARTPPDRADECEADQPEETDRTDQPERLARLRPGGRCSAVARREIMKRLEARALRGE